MTRLPSQSEPIAPLASGTPAAPLKIVCVQLLPDGSYHQVSLNPPLRRSIEPLPPKPPNRTTLVPSQTSAGRTREGGELATPLWIFCVHVFAPGSYHHRSLYVVPKPVPSA